MATPFSPGPGRSLLQPNPNSPKTLLSLPGSLHRGPHRARVRCNGHRVLCSGLSNGSAKLPGKSVVVKELLKWRQVKRYATTEEIQAEKAAVETNAKSKMEKTLDSVRSAFNSVRTDRANPAILDKIQVEYYGTPVSLKSLAQISTPDASSLLIQPYDKSSLKLIEKAIVSSNLDLPPSNDGETIRLSVPQLTSDKRKELAKLVAKQAEEGKVAVRNVRRDALKTYDKLKKEKKLSEDNVKDLSSDMQKLTDEYVKKIDAMYKQKEKWNWIGGQTLYEINLVLSTYGQV
ncbi:hypothetical protein Tsubulata_032246 [Turnera subulata]|uniref:Ribosome-recycling factor, chloroplastic n=1 Tax=Turnera subulata TaxID=218843 RepID=A0A9Q0JLR0_9ROSI|nr:hypothetical protein Tsubulata_032246 [Turnera subulata]